LDRFARSIRDLCAIVDRPEAKGVSLRILGMGLDTATANGRLMLNVLGSVAQFEREVMLERQREGVAKAKAEGKYKGRAPTARNKAEEVRAMAAAGMTRQVIAGKLGIVDSDARCNPVDSIGSSTKSRVSLYEPPPSARFPRDKEGSARRNIEPLSNGP